VIMVDDDVYQRVGAKKVRGIIDQYRAVPAVMGGCLMTRLTSFGAFWQCQKDLQKQWQERDPQIQVCHGGGCLASGATGLMGAFEKAIRLEGVRAEVMPTGCMGPCVAGPVVRIGEHQYEQVAPTDAAVLVREHFTHGRAVPKLMNEQRRLQLSHQQQIVLRKCGRIAPDEITDYLALGGYAGLVRALEELGPDGVLAEMKASGLRGRGGAGFPTWKKWDFTKQASGERKFALCNADEGDPGAFMDRSVLEGDPHSVIEGMLIAAYTIGASQGYLYVRAEYPLAVERLQIALSQAREYGLLGGHILGTEFSFDLDIRMGSGAFVCGEETALITSIEGHRGEPRPPFPAQQGLWQQPTLLNNVETYANVSYIVGEGGQAYARYGTERSKGTKVFALAGAIENSGLVEVPIGIPLGDLIYDIGGGIPGGRCFKAAQLGGPSGGCIPAGHLDVPVDYENLAELGAIMGSGGIVVMDDTSCMVDVARFFLEFVQEESCGKCVPCRVGTKRMLEILERICDGQGREADIDLLIELGQKIKDSALCGLGQTGPNPVLSTIRHFMDEYVAHIREKRCPAGVCHGLVDAPCRSGYPAAVDIPGFVSLVADGRIEEGLRLHRNRNPFVDRNPFVGVCARVCYQTCENRCRRWTLDGEAVSVRGVKRYMADREAEPQLPEVRLDADKARRRVAVIGAGPAGLSCAYFLARLGYRPDVFEAEHRAGGMLVQAIPQYRLPREIVDGEVRMIASMGVRFQFGMKLGEQITLEQLRGQGYEAVFLGLGAPDGLPLGIPGEEAEGVVDGLEFERDFNLTGSAWVGRRVAVVGGGNAAVDCARSALRLGAEEVTIVYRRTREQMPAYEEEIEQAIKEGVTICALTNPTKVVTDHGKVIGLQCKEMELGDFDGSGRRRPQDSGRQITIQCEQVITAIGQRLNLAPICQGHELRMRRDHFIEVDPATGRTSTKWIFAGGDAVSGPLSVVNAVGAGERAAVGINTLLTGESGAFWRTDKPLDTQYDPDTEPVAFPREDLPVMAVEDRSGNFNEVELGWSRDVAVRQAKRCLRCEYGKRVACEEVLQ
jgi:NADH-quinone oxidoreductase subunit F